MNWPLRWLTPVEEALNTYEVLTNVRTAMDRLEGDALTGWQARNKHMVKRALEIEQLRDEPANGN